MCRVYISYTKCSDIISTLKLIHPVILENIFTATPPSRTVTRGSGKHRRQVTLYETLGYKNEKIFNNLMNNIITNDTFIRYIYTVEKQRESYLFCQDIFPDIIFSIISEFVGDLTLNIEHIEEIKNILKLPTDKHGYEKHDLYNLHQEESLGDRKKHHKSFFTFGTAIGWISIFLVLIFIAITIIIVAKVRYK